MNVFVIGASGYIGTADSEALKAAGHKVFGSARSEQAAQKLQAMGVQPVSADITDPSSLKDPAARADATIYSVYYTGANVFEVESAALRTLVDALAGTNKALMYTSGVWIYGNTGNRRADEHSPLDPPALIAHRPRLERIVLDGAARGVRAIVIRAADVYGRGAGLPAMWVQSAKEEGAARFVGDGSSHWPVVHVEDLAQLYVSALEKAEAGSIYNAADNTSFTVREMARAASNGAGTNGAVTSWLLDDARNALGAFADALVIDSSVNSQKARKELGWQTRSSTILDDLTSGSYASPAA